MERHLFWVVFVAYFLFFNQCETKKLLAENAISNILSRVFANRIKPPIIFYLEPKPNARSVEEDSEDLRQNFRSIEENPEEFNHIRYEEEREEDDDENFLKTTQSGERAYLLYHLLRTTIEEEEIDPATVQHLQPAKEFLRNVFIGRCRKLNKCLRQCPKPKIRYSCTVQCKQIFDDLDECDEPKENKCGEAKCGNTMPPAWLL